MEPNSISAESRSISTSSETCFSIGSREYTSYLPWEKELLFKKNKNYLFPLSYLAGLSVTGKEAEQFLQGQVSCDVKEVQLNSMRKGAYCNLKGRILALLDIVSWSEYQLILPQDLLEATYNSLLKPAMLSRIKLEKASYGIYGFYLANPNDLDLNLEDLPLDRLQNSSLPYAVWQSNDYCCYYLGQQLYILLISNPEQFTLTVDSSFRKAGQLAGSFLWHYLLLSQKQMEIYPETRGGFLPHRLDLHLSGHLNFNKGCYKGQEIIARTHYKATLKHGLRLFHLKDVKEPLILGEKLLDPSTDAAIGELIDFTPTSEEDYLILVSIFFEHPMQIRFENRQDSATLEPTKKDLYPPSPS